jgi:hypothetical protein
MCAFYFGEITAVYFITIWTVFIFVSPSVRVLNTVLNTTAFKCTFVLT